MTASNFIKKFSAKTWSDIRFARNYAGIIRLGEVTITQNLILSIAYQYHKFPKSVYLFEAINERANGNDIELFIRNSRGRLIAYPCQAKIVDKKPNETYSQINHTYKSGKLQIDALLRYSKKLGGIPLYLFYNYSQSIPFRTSLVKERADYYGCSYTTATYIKYHYCSRNRWITPLPTFIDLHPLIGKPFYRLFELASKSLSEIETELKGLDAKVSNLINWPVRQYALSELQADNAWQAINYFQELEEAEELGRIFKQDAGYSEQSTVINELSGFAPKYRIVFT